MEKRVSRKVPGQKSFPRRRISVVSLEMLHAYEFSQKRPWFSTRHLHQANNNLSSRKRSGLPPARQNVMTGAVCTSRHAIRRAKRSFPLYFLVKKRKKDGILSFNKEKKKDRNSPHLKTISNIRLAKFLLHLMPSSNTQPQQLGKPVPKGFY